MVCIGQPLFAEFPPFIRYYCRVNSLAYFYMYMAQKLLHFSAQVQEERPDWGQMEALNLVNNIQDPILVNAAQDLSSSNDNNNQDTPIRYTAL